MTPSLLTSSPLHWCTILTQVWDVNSLLCASRYCWLKKEYRIRTYPWLESHCSLVVEAQVMESDITDHQNKPHSASWMLTWKRMAGGLQGYLEEKPLNDQLLSHSCHPIQGLLALSSTPYFFLKITFPRLGNSFDKFCLQVNTEGLKGEAKVFLSHFSFSLCFGGLGILQQWQHRLQRTSFHRTGPSLALQLLLGSPLSGFVLLWSAIVMRLWWQPSLLWSLLTHKGAASCWC